ncbi:MAG: SNF2-related protein, partial [Burkholderiales bacterium]|nr:SNF2-related protein [Burkholderiales bacterium]
MSAAAFAVPHLDAIRNLPAGLLYPHQADGVAFLISKGRAILADDMGLGKTRQAIVAMQVAAPEGAVLVVCPASLKLNWR